MNQGDVYLINLGPVVTSGEIAKMRPGLVISVDAMNHYSPRSIIAPVTSNVKKIYPFEVFIPSGVGGLQKDSKAMLDQMRCVDKRRLVRRLGALDRERLVEACKVGQRLISAD